MAPPRKISHSCSAGTLPTFSQLHVGGDGLLLVPAPSRPHATHQGHAHIIHNNGFLRVWVEVRGASIHVFPHEAASLPSIVVAQLDQCDVTVSFKDKSPSHSVQVARHGKEQLNLFFEKQEEAETWANMLRVTTVNRSLALEGLNLECGGADMSPPGTEKDGANSSSEFLRDEPKEVGAADEVLEEVAEEEEEVEEVEEEEEEGEEEEEEEEGDDDFSMEALDTFLGLLQPIYSADEDTVSGDSCETESQEDSEEQTPDGVPDGKTYIRLRHPRRNAPPKPKDQESRRELLQQMLATKSLLEKKQKNRKSGAGAWAITAGEVVNEYDRAQHEAQQLALRKAVLLKQRKNSTAIKMATLERQQHSSRKHEGDVSLQLEALRNRLSSLDSELKESEQDTERTLQNLEERRNQELHLIQDLGGVQHDELEGGLVGVPKSGGIEEGGSMKSSLGGSLRGSLSSIPSIVISSSEKKTPERIFGFKVGNRDGKLKGRNPLHFLDIKLRVSRRHKSTECLTTASDHHADRSHSSTPGNVSCSENSSDDEADHHHHHHHHNHNRHHSNHPNSGNHASGQHHNTLTNHSQLHHPHHQQGSDPDHSIRTEISKEALQEIEAFKQLIDRYFALHPRHDSITSHPHEILL